MNDICSYLFALTGFELVSLGPQAVKLPIEANLLVYYSMKTTSGIRMRQKLDFQRPLKEKKN